MVATLKGLAPKLGDHLGVGAGEMGALLFLTLVAQGVGFFALGSSERWGYRRATLLAAVPAAVLGLGLWLLAGRLDGVLVLAVAGLGALAVGAAQAVTYAASVFYSIDYDERRGLRTGIHEAVLGIGGGLEILGGILADATGRPDAPLLLMIGLGLVASAGGVWLLRGSSTQDIEQAREKA
jgi:hypothetical protein